MHQQIYVNLPCRDLAASRAFFEAMGYRFDPRFTNDKGAGMALGENLFAMLLTREFAQTFTAKSLVDPRTATTGWVCLSCDSPGQVDALVAKARAAGGSVTGEPQDHGFMYGHGFEDLDGHHWELVHMRGLPPQA